MKAYFAGPLFTAAEQAWNRELTAALRAAGHEVFLPQEKEKGKTAAGMFAYDVGGIDWADAPVPDSGAAWEVGYACATRKPVVAVRTDIRRIEGVVGAVLGALRRLESDR